MSGYGTGEELIQSLIESVSGFSGAVARGSWRALNGGKSARYAVLITRPTARQFETSRTIREDWETVVQIWIRYRDDGTTYTDLGDVVTAVLAKLDAYPHLNDTSGYVEDSTATIGGEVQEMWRGGGGPAWLRQDVVIQWTGRQTIIFVSGG